MRRFHALAAGAASLLLVGTAAPADAETRTRGDHVWESVPDRLDLMKVRWSYGEDRFVVAAHLDAVRRKDVLLHARSSHEGEGYEVEARTWWREGRKVDRLWIAYNTQERTRITCPGLESHWKRGDEGTIRISVPNACLFDGAAMDDLRVVTSRSGSSEAIDRIVSRRSLTSG